MQVDSLLNDIGWGCRNLINEKRVPTKKDVVQEVIEILLSLDTGSSKPTAIGDRDINLNSHLLSDDSAGNSAQIVEISIPQLENGFAFKPSHIHKQGIHLRNAKSA